MKGLTTGILLGVGIGLLFAPMPGEEMRHLLGKRFQDLRVHTIVKQYIPQFSGDSSKMRLDLPELAKFALSQVKANERTLNALARFAVDRATHHRLSFSDLAGFASTVRKRAS